VDHGSCREVVHYERSGGPNGDRTSTRETRKVLIASHATPAWSAHGTHDRECANRDRGALLANKHALRLAKTTVFLLAIGGGLHWQPTPTFKSRRSASDNQLRLHITKDHNQRTVFERTPVAKASQPLFDTKNRLDSLPRVITSAYARQMQSHPSSQRSRPEPSRILDRGARRGCRTWEAASRCLWSLRKVLRLRGTSTNRQAYFAEAIRATWATSN
jgi:hypothetical protein